MSHVCLVFGNPSCFTRNSAVADVFIMFRRYRGPAVSYRYLNKRKFPSPPSVSNVTTEGVPWNWGNGAWAEKSRRMRYLAGDEVWGYILPFGYNNQVWRTDRQTDSRSITSHSGILSVSQCVTPSCTLQVVELNVTPTREKWRVN